LLASITIFCGTGVLLKIAFKDKRRRWNLQAGRVLVLLCLGFKI
jgi:hypothetical protein